MVRVAHVRMWLREPKDEDDSGIIERKNMIGSRAVLLENTWLHVCI